MCTRYIISTTQADIESIFSLPPQFVVIENNYNISPGELAPVITNDKPYEIQLFKFGLTPFWAKAEMNLINARTEGEYNQDDNPKFSGAKGILLTKAFRKPIRSQRCIVIASAFIEGLQGKASQPFVVYLRKQQNPFAMAGIWDTWLNPANGFPENSFSIITTTANSLLRQIGSKRMPVILSGSQARRWIKSGVELTNITAMLRHYDSQLMNAYPIDSKIKKSTENDKLLIKPTGEKVLPEEKTPIINYPHTSGFHQAKRANKAADTSTMEERQANNLAKEKEKQQNEEKTPYQ
jgi:putative SOS response-associated peptidase YedK